MEKVKRCEYFPDALYMLPEEQFLSRLLLDDVELVVVPQCAGHLLIGHIGSVLERAVIIHFIYSSIHSI